MFDDTIAAIATPLGEGGLAVIRLSGPKALPILDQCFRTTPRSQGTEKRPDQPATPSSARSHTIQHGRVHRNGRDIDEVLVSLFRRPKSYTREDVVEISCHGGIVVTKAILDTLLAYGARLAHPGEFTKRAFLNGRLDLAQAEAVADLIHARTELAANAAHEQLAGNLSRHIDRLREELMRVLAHMEAHIDFPDEDIAPDTRNQMIETMEAAVAEMSRLLATANEGKILRRGIRAVIIGRPNAGKSSLLNHLLGQDRAIVSEQPGTTRDSIEETANIRGIPVVFIDTAGLRDAADDIEAQGIERSRRHLAQAELVLHVLDRSEPWHETDAQHLHLAQQGKRRWILIENKCDLPRRLELPSEIRPAGPLVGISCTTGEGIDALKETIATQVWSGRLTAGTEQIAINARHQDALQRAKAGTEACLQALRDDLPLELPALDLRSAVNAIGEIVGKTSTEDLLDSIFSQFCLGK